jgi:Golgi nucleoside diphosphatase
MSKRNRSIGDRLKNSRSNTWQLEICNEWAIKWEKDQMNIVKMLEAAIRNNDYDNLCRATGQLKTVTKKRFSAIPNIFNNLADTELKGLKKY